MVPASLIRATMDLQALIAMVAAGRELTHEHVAVAARALADGSVAAADKEAFLETLTRRGETPAEIAAFAQAFRGLARNPALERWAADGIDVCGTGGDRSGTFNVSTAVAFVLAAGGVPVIKHGNRSITSHCGSADLLEALGLRIDADAATLQRSMAELNFVFLFAPLYHPAFKEIVPVRKALAARGVRTVFNLLGPLLNPARPAHQIMGVPAEMFVAPVARALEALGLASGYAVHGSGPDGRAFDELTVTGPNRLIGFGRLRGIDERFDATSVGLASGTPADLAGGDKTANVALLDRLLAGDAPRALADTIVLNAAAALHALGRTASIRDGIATARDLLLGGAARQWLQRAQAFYRAA